MPFHSRISGQEVQQRIINLMKSRGPVLPIHVAKDTGLTTILAGAYLSTMLDDKAIKVSHLKVGGSPLYFLSGQEAMLENFCIHLPGKEKEAFSLLKERKLLQDSELEPAIRIAIRNIKDFAFPFATDEHPDLVFWRFYSLNLEEADVKAKEKLKLVERKPQITMTIPPISAQAQITTQQIIPAKAEEEKKLEAKPEIKIEGKIVEKQEEKAEKPEEKKEVKLEVKEEKTEAEKKEKEKAKEKQKPLISIIEKKEKKKEKKINLDFFEEVKEFLLKKDIELLQEVSISDKEVIGKVRIDSNLGKLVFLMIAKDKKRVADSDFIMAYQKAIGEKLPCYFLSKSELSKKNLDFLEEYKNLVRVEKIS